MPSGRLSEDEQQDRILENLQSTPGDGEGLIDTTVSVIPTGSPPLPEDKYQLLKEECSRTRDELRQVRDNYDRGLRRRNVELRQASQFVGHLLRESRRSKDSITGLQNELNDVRRQLKDANTLPQVPGKEFSVTQVDSLSISEVGEKVTALNDEIFLAAAVLGGALIHESFEVSQTKLDAAAAESREIIGEKLTNILIAQSRKPEPNVNTLLVQVVLQIVMVKFCFFKIQSWYPGDSAFGGYLAAIYSEIRSNGKHCIDSKPSFCLTQHFFRGTGRFRSMACSYSCSYQTQH